MILINSNVNKFFIKQHSNTLHCFPNRRSLDESSSSMDKKFFLKKIEVTRFIARLFHLTTIEGQSKEESINRVHFFKSYNSISFNCLRISLGSKSAINWPNTFHFLRLRIKKVAEIIYYALTKSVNLVNPFSPSVTFLYPLKTSENLWLSDVFRGYRNVTLD